MSRDSIIKPVLAVFGAAVLLYVLAYATIEHLRTRKGAWEITFSADPQGVPSLSISELRLGIHDVRLRFPEQHLAKRNETNVVLISTSMTSLPFGKVVYFDTTFLPGAVVFDMFGHQIQLLPRTLILDRREVPWQSETVTDLGSAPTNPPVSHL